jgi:cell fate regulator YaaT (PSP1 superfamily)
MCCLRFEDEVYTDLKRSLPRKGARVVYSGKNAEVIDADIIQQKLRILVEGRDVQIVTAKEVQVIAFEPREREQAETEAGGAEKREERPQNESAPQKPEENAPSGETKENKQ